jgi:hypothetical protein
VRERIPGFDDHVSFANFDLKLNSLPRIDLSREGRPFVMCLDPLDEDEMRLLPLDPSLVSASINVRDVVTRMAQVKRILDVVHYHGFQPANRTPGLDYLDRIAPRSELREQPIERKPE